MGVDEMRQPFQVLVYPATSFGGDWRYLLLRRVPIPGLGVFWQGVTGGLEEGEDLGEAGMRELVEETGFIPSVLKRIDYSYSVPMRDEWREKYPAGVEEIVEYVFIAVIEEQLEPMISCEHDRWMWCSLDQALELLTWPGNIGALKRCDHFLQRMNIPALNSKHNNYNTGHLLGQQSQKKQ
jgi:8-oxo-dGTP pyrophosphatase MutT (NUDIX family)